MFDLGTHLLTRLNLVRPMATAYYGIDEAMPSNILLYLCPL
jgi:hypothetical protein